MPRTYKPKPGARAYDKSVDTEILAKAASAVKDGVPQCEVCREFGLSRTKLSNHLQVVNGEKPLRSPGGQSAITAATERAIVDHLLAVSEWGFPFDLIDLRMVVKRVLDKHGVTVAKFRDNVPGHDWALSFMKRHSDQIKNRMCQNITKKRAGFNVETVNNYFAELSKTLQGVPPQNIINYDETNLTDDPGRRRMIFRRGVKYPERILNGTKSSTSLMLAGTAAGELLPLYVVYKSENLWDTWRQGGPPRTRYNRSRSGWFDHICFYDWFSTVAIPYCRKLPGRKVLIGDNLSSHFSNQILQECEDNNIAFVCLPPNATHLCQPLDVAYFGPMKRKWRSILTEWKQPGQKQAGTVPKDVFPKLLKRLMSELPNKRENMLSGFRKCGIHPLDPNPVLNRLPKSHQEMAAENDRANNSVSEVFLNQLSQMRNGEEGATKRAKRRRVDVVPGRSVGAPDDEEEQPADAAEAAPEASADVSDSESETEVEERNLFETFAF
ncbi:hypothetical protein RRG08_023563 [Elysia crispata]|uniref:DDE-1 domain-containing protein n=1 Tax=Elysia crispata TaxID=231223 RepID=A0AAE1DCM2_9GAST|nr:hypothetical protein RRG08_023563 [Elysia crispata]